jgi:hypothetical protein
MPDFKMVLTGDGSQLLTVLEQVSRKQDETLAGMKANARESTGLADQVAGAMKGQLGSIATAAGAGAAILSEWKKEIQDVNRFVEETSQRLDEAAGKITAVSARTGQPSAFIEGLKNQAAGWGSTLDTTTEGIKAIQTALGPEVSQKDIKQLLGKSMPFAALGEQQMGVDMASMMATLGGTVMPMEKGWTPNQLQDVALMIQHTIPDYAQQMTSRQSRAQLEKWGQAGGEVGEGIEWRMAELVTGQRGGAGAALALAQTSQEEREEGLRHPKIGEDTAKDRAEQKFATYKTFDESWNALKSDRELRVGLLGAKGASDFEATMEQAEKYKGYTVAYDKADYASKFLQDRRATEPGREAMQGERGKAIDTWALVGPQGPGTEFADRRADAMEDIRRDTAEQVRQGKMMPWEARNAEETLRRRQNYGEQMGRDMKALWEENLGLGGDMGWDAEDVAQAAQQSADANANLAKTLRAKSKPKGQQGPGAGE